MNKRDKMKRNILIVTLISISIIGCCKVKQDNDLQNVANLTSSEYKLLLNPEKFDDYKQGFENYWKIIQDVAEENNVPVLVSENPLKESHKNIGFFDTKNLDLRKNGYMIRRKLKFKNGIIKLINNKPVISCMYDAKFLINNIIKVQNKA